MTCVVSVNIISVRAHAHVGTLPGMISCIASKPGSLAVLM